MLKKLLLLMSKSKLLMLIFSKAPGARYFSRRFVAGETLEDAVDAVKKLNEAGMMVSLDHLGESVSEKEEAEAAAEACLEILDAIAKDELTANISVKLTQLGLDIDKKLCESLMRKIAKKAKKHKLTVRIDMEDSDCVDRTLALYRKLHKTYKNIGVVIQSYLMRSEADVKELIELGASVRLCKGAYDEPEDIAFKEKKMVDHNFLYLAGILFSDTSLANGTYPCIATHDETIINTVKKETKEQKILNRRFEFQMLYGVRPKLQKKLAKKGYRVRIYVPYGTHWYPYFMRRLAERPANLWFFLRNLFKG